MRGDMEGPAFGRTHDGGGHSALHRARYMFTEASNSRDQHVSRGFCSGVEPDPVERSISRRSPEAIRTY